MRIKLSSVRVDDQDKALAFYTDILPFIKKTEIPVGSARWLTVVSPEGPGDIELLLEPMMFAPAVSYQKRCSKPGFRRRLLRSTTSRMSSRG